MITFRVIRDFGPSWPYARARVFQSFTKAKQTTVIKNKGDKPKRERGGKVKLLDKLILQGRYSARRPLYLTRKKGQYFIRHHITEILT